eukprot:9504020-Pyramimonas_sp.AAC.1
MKRTVCNHLLKHLGGWGQEAPPPSHLLNAHAPPPVHGVPPRGESGRFRSSLRRSNSVASPLGVGVKLSVSNPNLWVGRNRRP